jgi:inorganic triphosphatase YgiF
MTQRLETEHKYEVGADFTLPDLAGLAAGLSVTGPAVHHLDASYFDTPDLRLAAAGITLRRRTGGTDAGWHLKLPVSAGTRRELHAPLGDGPAAVPGVLARQVAGQAAGQPLRLVAILTTIRTVWRLTGPGGEARAEVADDQVTGQRPDLGTTVSWREIEVELTGGGPDILAAAGARLRAAGARPSAAASKLSRVLGLAPDGSAPADSAPDDPAPDDPDPGEAGGRQAAGG